MQTSHRVLVDISTLIMYFRPADEIILSKYYQPARKHTKNVRGHSLKVL